MSIKSKNKRVGICLMVVASCIVLAGLWVVLATPETALAKKPVKPPGTTIYFDVLLGMDGGDIFMVSGSPIEGRIESIGGGTSSDRIIVNKRSPHIDITSVINVVKEEDPQDAADCFDVLLDVTKTRYIGGIEKGVLLIELPDRAVNQMTVAYAFIAKDTKGKDVSYTIRTTGTLTDLDPDYDVWGGLQKWIDVQDAVNDGTANPGEIPNFFVQVDGDWTLSKSDGSQKFACTGSGTFDSGFGISITRPRLERENNTLP